MDFEFEDFVIREVGHENRKMQTSKKTTSVLQRSLHLSIIL